MKIGFLHSLLRPDEKFLVMDATVRTGAHFGAERVRDEWDFSVGASLQHRGVGGAQTELTVEHGPAYPVTATLQSSMVGVVQDHVEPELLFAGTEFGIYVTIDGGQEWHELSGGSEIAVAVRSSMSYGNNDDDSLFLGQQERLLNVADLSQVIAGIHEVYASMYSDRAITHRAHQGLDHGHVSMSVTVV